MRLDQGFGINPVARLCALPGGQCLACMGELFCVAHVVQDLKLESVALGRKYLRFGAIELLEHVMQSRGVTRKDFEPAIGKGGRVAEIFNRVRPLSLEIIRRLVVQFDLPADVLVKPYALRNLISCETK